MIWGPVPVIAPKQLGIQPSALDLCFAGGLAMVHEGTADIP